jgi:hypothetical protein
MSVCVKCGGEGPFYANRPYRCIKCDNAASKAYREANRERLKAYDSERIALPHRVLEKNRYRAEHPEIYRKIRKAWIKRNPEKRGAQEKLRDAVARGKIVKPESCQRCGSQGRIHAHHADYAKPLEVEWLCHRCHANEHWT